MRTMMFAVMEFPEEKRVAIVPSPWVMQSGKLCMWPPSTYPHHKIISAVKKQKPPPSGWSVCPSRRLSKCGVLQKQPACGSKGFSSRKRDMDVSKELPVPPRGQLTEPASPELRSPVQHLQQPLPIMSKSLDNISLSELHEPTLEEPEEECKSLFSQATEAIEDHIVKHLAECKQHNKEEIDALKDIKQVQLDIFHRVTEIKGPDKCAQTFTADDLDLPLKTMSDFSNIHKLLQGKAECQTLKKYLAGFGGATLDAAARAVVSRVMSPKLQIQSNMTGRKGRKLPFKGTNVCTVIIGAIMQRNQDVNERAVEQAVGRFLDGAADRDGG